MTVSTYIIYLLLSISLTVWVAQTLFNKGLYFLVDAFGDKALADSVNHLLVVGFYLINLGYVSLNLKLRKEVLTTQESIEALSYKIGFVLLVLGFMHFFNLYVFSKIRKQRRLPHAAPPVTPGRYISPQPKGTDRA